MTNNKIFPILGLVCAGVPVSSCSGESATKKMNVLFIAVDDLKPTVGAYGDPLAVTPAIDRIAERGTVFTHAYCQQAISAASRASILTGMRPDKTKVWDLVTDFRQVNPNAVSLPQYFREQGYETAAWGKIFHVGSTGKGHDAPSWSVPYRNITAPAYALPVVMNDRDRAGATECADVPDDTYRDGKTAEAAIGTLRQLATGDKPFFLAVGFIRPHLPFNAPKKYWDLYDRKKLPLAGFQKKASGSPEYAYHASGELKSYSDIPQFDSYSSDPQRHLPVEKQRELIHGYYAAVSYMDAQVGRLLDELDRLGLSENTVIVLWGDHGWHLGDHGLWNKHSNFENAAHVPLIISVPGKPGGGKADGLCEFVDVFPTLCDLNSLPSPEWLDGISLVGAMDDPATRLRDYALSQYPRPKGVMGYSIRTERFRYAEWFGDGYTTAQPYDPSKVIAREMYDYRNDPFETVSLIGDPACTEQQRELETLFRSCMEREHGQYLRYEKLADYHAPVDVKTGKTTITK